MSRQSDAKDDERLARDARLAARLRDNLKRRKGQARARAGEDGAREGGKHGNNA
jgi:hypothetical protein